MGGEDYFDTVDDEFWRLSPRLPIYWAQVLLGAREAHESTWGFVLPRKALRERRLLSALLSSMRLIPTVYGKYEAQSTLRYIEKSVGDTRIKQILSTPEVFMAPKTKGVQVNPQALITICDDRKGFNGLVIESNCSPVGRLEQWEDTGNALIIESKTAATSWTLTRSDPFLTIYRNGSEESFPRQDFPVPPEVSVGPLNIATSFSNGKHIGLEDIGTLELWGLDY